MCPNPYFAGAGPRRQSQAGPQAGRSQMYSWGPEDLPHALRPPDHWMSHPGAPSGAGAPPILPHYLGLGLAGLHWGTAEGRPPRDPGRGTPGRRNPRCPQSSPQRQKPGSLPGPPWGPMRERPRPPATDSHKSGDPGDDSCWDQQDPTFSRAYDKLAAVDGVVTDPQRAVQWSWFELR